MRRTVPLALALALAAAGGGCAPSNPGLVVTGVIAPPAGGTSCLFDSSAMTFITSGVLDTMNQNAAFDLLGVPYFGVRYVARVRVENHLMNLFNNRYPLRADPNVMIISSADVEVLQIDGSPFSFGALPNPFRVAASGTVDSAGSDTPGLGVATFEMIPPQYGAALAGLNDVRLNFVVRLNGRTTGDATVQSPEFFYSIDLCANCLYACSGDITGAASCDPGQDGQTLFPGGVGGCPVVAGP